MRKKIIDFMPFTPEQVHDKGNGFYYKGNEFIPHNTLAHQESALTQINRKQKYIIASLLIILLAAMLISWHITFTVLIGGITVLYFLDLLFNLNLIARSLYANPDVTVDDETLRLLDETVLPMYTVLCPLYKESAVLPQFVEAMTALDYPVDKLQIMLLLEANDSETITAAEAMNLPSQFEIIVVPHSLPKTKPKACNYGLIKARGDLVVIYDAEDKPDTAQLKKAYVAFEKAGQEVACIQSKLNFYNPHQNLLTRVFTAEYSLWFDLVLSGMQLVNAPIPLGGTSNHFRTSVLKELGGWDAFNVTEDADLGIRLAKRGYKTLLLDSTTLEEANSSPVNWFWQRSRWIKGYIQTYLVHTRRLKTFREQTGRYRAALTFQLIIGGKVLALLINPVMWLLTIIYFVFRPVVGPTIESVFPAPVLYMGVVSLLFGNFLYLYYYMVGCVRRQQYDLVKAAFMVPLYWIAMSAAAFYAMYELVYRPHHWRKTKHGLHLANTPKENA